jgi:secreted trypsin-like serine protease
MKNFTMGSILALLLAVLSACAPANQNGSSNAEQAQANSIIGGKVVMPGSALSKQVFMLFGMSSQGQYICTATLITQQHVLTAAHCVDGAKKMYAVFAVDAVAKLKKGGLASDPNIVEVSSAKVYPKWGGAQGGKVDGIDVGDIAVLRLSKPAPADMKVTKLYNSSLRKGQVLVASGYGVESGTLHTGSGLLREVNVVVEEPLVGKSEFYIDQTNGKGICSGDSGGPSFVQSSFGELQQVGVTSRGDEHCAQGGLYTLVPAYNSWINQTVRQLTK